MDLTDEINNKLLLGTDKDVKTAWQRAADGGFRDLTRSM